MKCTNTMTSKKWSVIFILKNLISKDLSIMKISQLLPSWLSKSFDYAHGSSPHLFTVHRSSSDKCI